MVDPDRVERQLDFLLEVDRLKRVERVTRITGGLRRENSAEHSWHLALLALVLGEHAVERVELSTVVAMLLVHDLVEIDAGDTFAYDDTGHESKEAREQAAATRLYGLLPDDQRDRLRALWDEFERGDTPEARFALALDRLHPVVMNHANDGDPWLEHGISRARVEARNSLIGDHAPALWEAALRRLDDLEARGRFPEAAVVEG